MFRILLLLFLAVTSPVLAHWDAAYFRNATDGFTLKKNWMGAIGDDVMLSELALPGTHDSGTYKKHIESVITQTLTINQQLDYGIRVLDIRIRHTGNKFALHHGAFFLDVMFGDVLKSVNDFLAKNPSETVLLILKKELEPDTNNTRSVKDTLREYLTMYHGRFLDTENPAIRLGDARGKFVIAVDEYALAGMGLTYSLFHIRDNFKLTTNWDLHDKKWGDIKKHLAVAQAGESKTFFVNYLSGSTGVFPYFVASGHSSPGTSAPRLATGLTTPGWKSSYPDFPRVNCFGSVCTIAFEGTNILTRDKLLTFNAVMSALKAQMDAGTVDANALSDIGIKRSVGIIMADFPGESLINSIINNNVLLLKPTSPVSKPTARKDTVSNVKLREDVLTDIKNKRPDLYASLHKKVGEMVPVSAHKGN